MRPRGLVYEPNESYRSPPSVNTVKFRLLPARCKSVSTHEPQQDTIQFELPKWLASELDDDEQLLWVGSPASGIHFRPADAFAPYAIIVGFLAGCMAIFMMKSYFLGFMMWSYATFLLLGRHRYDARKRAKTWYVLTDQRALVGTNYFVPEKVHSYPRKDWFPLELVKEKNTHSIWFTRKSGFWHGTICRIRHGFMLIGDGPNVFDLMKKVRWDRF